MWTDPGTMSGIRASELVSTSTTKKQKQKKFISPVSRLNTYSRIKDFSSTAAKLSVISVKIREQEYKHKEREETIDLSCTLTRLEDKAAVPLTSITTECPPIDTKLI